MHLNTNEGRVAARPFSFSGPAAPALRSWAFSAETLNNACASGGGFRDGVRVKDRSGKPLGLAENNLILAADGENQTVAGRTPDRYSKGRTN